MEGERRYPNHDDTDAISGSEMRVCDGPDGLHRYRDGHRDRALYIAACAKGFSRQRAKSTVMRTTRTVQGTDAAKSATTAPAQRLRVHPIPTQKASKFVLGISRPSAKDRANCSSLTQRRLSTTSPWMTAVVALPPSVKLA
jgi:hypothetical protein